MGCRRWPWPWIALLLGGASGDLAERWHSDACATTHATAAGACAAVDTAEEACALVPRAPFQRNVRESACPGGRGNSTTPPHAAQEVVIVPELRIVWIVNRKAASSLLRALFTRHFDAYWTKCGDRREVAASCAVIGGRCSSLCLSMEEVRNYFFVAFVRDPTDRFYSALKESVRMGHPLTPPGVDAAGALALLARPPCGVDHHLESQALALSTPLAFQCGERTLAAPVDFVGRVSRLAVDFLAALDAAAEVTGRRLSAAERAGVERTLKANVGNVGGAKESLAFLRDPEIDAAISGAYAQDEACFSGVT